jgi:hypothetical protein
MIGTAARSTVRCRSAPHSGHEKAVRPSFNVIQADIVNLQSRETRMRALSRRGTIKAIKLTHRYLGLFFAPVIVFFSFSGALQTLGLHSPAQGSNYLPARWIIYMAQLHKKQTPTLPVAKAKTPASDSGAARVDSPKKEVPNARRALQFFVVLMSAALIATTLLGIVMALAYGGNQRVTVLILVAGARFPVCIMLV